MIYHIPDISAILSHSSLDEEHKRRTMDVQEAIIRKVEDLRGKTFPKEEYGLHNFYQGELEDELPHGFGYYQVPRRIITTWDITQGYPSLQDEHGFLLSHWIGPIKSYQGFFEKGTCKGICHIQYQQGHEFIGEIDAPDNMAGIIKNRCGSVIVITQGDNPESQKGSIFYPDGSIYVGELKKGKPHGMGKRISSNEEICEGVWHEGKFCLFAKRSEV